MFRDLKFLRRNSGKSEEIENVPINPKASSVIQTDTDSLRPPLSSIQDPTKNPKPDQEFKTRTKHDKTPIKAKGKSSDNGLPIRTPEKHGAGFSGRHRFGWAQKNETGSGVTDLRDDQRNYSRGNVGNGGLGSMTPRSTRRATTSSNSECNSTQSTPTKSVSKPPNTGFRSKIDGNGCARAGNFAALYRGIPISGATGTVVNTVEVPHFDLKEDPSFWMDHSVQVIIRVRPLNCMERNINGYNRCLKQESAQSITWVGQPEARFTFDHVACETVDQQMLFRMTGLPMVENCLSGYNSCMFAYGQTGSGKTYTMLGEIEDLEVKPSLHRGMTPRIFEFLFARIQDEEERRRDEKLKYNCKCSFLEIYNEQITDLLDPSSTNLLLREDAKKGVYVENLSEFDVQTVSDILNLLTQGSSNRKVAATNMNRESSRSHSVFTCVIESRWEKDSTTNLRFARLNLVDLAGSERQKTSGAEGERLKEAANINKSLSTLGHVIMVLVDMAHGKPKHVPYRDSRLTFLLQDSLGGNSKTMIIANVSPSMCCAAETLNTLKFAQRAKLIQNNAVVNEDSTGDVIALQYQIRLLKEELCALKRQNISRSLSFGSTTMKETIQVQQNACAENTYEMDQQLLGYESKGTVRMSTKQLKSWETTLAGAFRREQMAETSIKQLEAEIEQLNRLVHQREEDTRSAKLMLRFREDKIQRMETLLDGSIPADSYLLEENKALSEEIQLLQAKVDRNPEVTRFALENIRLLDQLRRFQDFYEEGEREILLAEVSKLRDQVLQFLDGNSGQHNNLNLNMQPQLKSTLNELEECKCSLNYCLEENAKLSRQLDGLHSLLSNINSMPQNRNCSDETIEDSLEAPHFDFHMLKAVQNVEEGERKPSLMNDAEEIINLQLELDILKTILKEERSFRGEVEEKAVCLNRNLDLAEGKLLLVSKQCEEANSKLEEAKSIIEALESQQLLAINEVEDLRNSNSNSHFVELTSKQDLEIIALKEQLSSRELRDHAASNHLQSEGSPLQAKLKRMQDSLEKAMRLNAWYQSDKDFQVSNEEEMDEVCKQAEAETAEVIVCMQEELAILQQQVQESHLKEMETKKNVMLLEIKIMEGQEKLYLLTEDNKSLREKLEEKDVQLRTLSEEWELLTCEIEEVLADGHEALRDASDQLDLISSSFPQKRVWISEQIGRITRIISDKELLIEELHRCLENANNKKSGVECMLKSLRGATLAITEAHQQECSEKEKEILLLTSELSAKTSTIETLEHKIKLVENHFEKASTCATVAFVIVKRLSEINLNHIDELKQKDIQLSESAKMNKRKVSLLSDQSDVITEAENQIQSLRKELGLLEENCAKLRQELSEEQKRACVMERMVEDIDENDILQTKEKLAELNSGVSTLRSCMSMYAEHVGCPASENTLGVSVAVDGNGEGRTDTGTYQDNRGVNFHSAQDLKTDTFECSLKVAKSMQGYIFDQGILESKRICKDAGDRDVLLLKMEIESALESLKEVQAEMVKLRDEKEEIWMSEKLSQEGMRCLTTHVISLQAAMNNFEKQSDLKMEALTHKLQVLEQNVQEAGSEWCQTKELLELEVGDAKVVASQKTAEASCILAKFEEAQYMIEDADIMINGLMIANETMKLEIERLKKTEVMLISEKNMLTSEVQSLRSTNDLQYSQYENLENQLSSNLTETRVMFVELEGIIAQVQTVSKDNFMSIAHDLQCIKSLLVDSGKLVRSWLEDIWSEIVAKDCAVSVLHLCNMGILLETVTGLNAENGLLQHGLCESNSVIADLREHNFKSRSELEMCRILKGKLLADIKNSFDRVSRKEEGAGDLSVKLTTFANKISNLQLQEELMLQRSNNMGSQLATLMKELDLSNTNAVASLLDQERLLKDTEGVLKSQVEYLMINFYSKDFESLVLASELEDVIIQRANGEREQIIYCEFLENLQTEMILFQVDAELKEQILLDKEVEVTLLQYKAEEAQREKKALLSKLNQCTLSITEKDEVSKALEKYIEDISCSNDTLKGELSVVMEAKARLLDQVQALEAEHKKQLNDLNIKDTALQFSSSQISVLDEQNQKLQNNICLLESLSRRLQIELDMKDEELWRLSCLEEENSLLKSEARKIMTEKCSVLQDLEDKKSENESTLSCIDVCSMENHKLQDEIFSLESRIASLHTDLETKNAELNERQHSESVMMEEVHTKSQDLQMYIDRVNALKEENVFLREELGSYKKSKFEALTLCSLRTGKCLELVETGDMMSSRLFNMLKEKSIMIFNKMFEDSFENLERSSKFIEDVECLELLSKDLMSENLTLQAELSRKDDVLKGLLFDLSLLQESASNTKDQKDEIEEMVASLEALEDELALKSGELDAAVSHSQMLEAQLQENIDIISSLGLDIAKERESLKLLSSENIKLIAHIKDTVAAKSSVEEELKEKRKVTEDLEMELSKMSNAVGEMNNMIDTLKSNLDELTSERDHFHMEVLSLVAKLDKAQAQAVENEAIAMEAQQMAESRRIHVEEKEEEVKLLEMSVQELDHIINVLENKVDILKGEADRQSLQREELELELLAVKNQMQNVQNADADMKRHLNEKERNLQDALKHIKVLGKDIAEQDAEIALCKAHISQLNLHAEAQACEFKQKFKAFEAMAEQIKPEGLSTHATNSSSNKSEKNVTKPRGSGSPFKCIGLGLAQQMKSENDEELTAARVHIEELESLAISRQKEIFTLNARLAAAESMTHDVIRDLLGVKLDMANYASLLENREVQKITETAQLHNLESQVKEQEVIKLKQQLNEFVQERRGWLEEIDRKQAEMVAAQIALEELRQRDQLLKAENEMLKMENVNQKTKVMELEAEARKLSGQQNLQQRIHHHAKIKEENNTLKLQNEELSSKLRRGEVILSRVKEELARYRASTGRNPYIDFDKEQQLNNKLKETEEERVQLAQKLLGLCTSILKAAGITKPVSDISPTVAEEALEHIMDRFTSLERELHDLKFKNRIRSERHRLSELIPRTSPVSSRTDDQNCQTPRRASQAPFLSAFER